MAEIIPSPDFSVSGSTWRIRNTATKEIVWTARGGNVGLVVDNDAYMATFLSMFPLLVTAKGPGKFRIEAEIGGAVVGMIGHLRDWWEAPNVEVAQQAQREVNSGMMVPSFVLTTTKPNPGPMVVRDQTEGEAAGFFPMPASEAKGSGRVMVVPPSPSIAQSDKALSATTDTITIMRTLATIFKGTVVVRQATWIERLIALSKTFEGTGSTPSPYVTAPFVCRSFVGTLAYGHPLDSTIPYHLAKASNSPVGGAYLDWFTGYQTLEPIVVQLQDILDGTPTTDDSVSDLAFSAFSLLHAMSYTAAAIYLCETGEEVNDANRVNAIRSLCDFVADKDADYGQSIRRHGLRGIVVRMFDKFARYTTLCARPDRTAKFEGIQDTARDLLCYSLMATAFAQEIVDLENANLIA